MNFFSFLNWKYRGGVIRIAGIDMGSRNTSITITDHCYGKVPVLVFSEIVPVPVNNMSASLEIQTRAFRRYFNDVLTKYNPDIIVPELFMQRSFRSNLASPISYMIGLMAEIAHQHKAKTKATMPSHWKGSLKKHITKVDDIYDRTYPIKQRLPDHPVDALCLSIFHSPYGFKSVTQCQLLALRDQIKDSTSIQTWLKNEALKKPTPKKKVQKRKKKKAKRKKPLPQKP